MGEITKPLMLDETGRATVDALLQIADAINPKAGATVYGFHVNGNESDPDKKVTYLEDAVGMTPVHMDFENDVFDYGSWGNAWFIRKCRPCILGQNGAVQAYLDPNDQTKDINGNTVTIDNTLTDANVMIEFPKIWYKVVSDADDKSASIYFSPIQLDEDYKDYAYIDKDGNHKEHFYMPAYNSSLIDGKFRSVSGMAAANSYTAEQEIAYAKANGEGWNIEDAGEIMLINFLLILLGKSTDTQTVYGRGIDSGSQTEADAHVTGEGNAKGLFYGQNNGTTVVKVFGIENWWGFRWRRYVGDILDNGVLKVKLCYGIEDGSTVTDFNLTGEGYVEVGVTLSGASSGYINKMKFIHDGMYSSVSSGSSSTDYCDGQWFNNAIVAVALRGGCSDSGLPCGTFYVARDHGAWYRAWHIVAALSWK